MVTQCCGDVFSFALQEGTVLNFDPSSGAINVELAKESLKRARGTLVSFLSTVGYEKIPQKEKAGRKKSARGDRLRYVHPSSDPTRSLHSFLPAVEPVHRLCGF